MEKVVKISRPNPHSGQEEALQGLKRFNVWAMGRRYGKTVMAIDLAMEAMIDGKLVGYYVPTPEFAEEFWEEIKERLDSIILYKSESKKIIRLITGGELKIWSLEKLRSSRGRKYHRVIIDEAAFAKDLEYSWNKVIRATLTDYRGDAFFFSSPVFGTYFHTLFGNSKKYDNWASLQMPTHKNPYINQDELIEIEKTTDPLTWAQEYLAQFVNMAGRAFAYCFDRNKHVKDFGEFKKSLPVYLSFDFNVDPITCIASQHPDDYSYIYVRHEFRLGNSDIWKLCEAIKVKLDGFYFIVTGDASGQNRSGLARDNINYYTVIKSELNLQSGQIKVPNANPSIKNNRILLNSLLYRHPKVMIHPECKYLIQDLELVQVKENGDIDKKNESLTHLLDTFRYYLNTFFYFFVKVKN